MQPVGRRFIAWILAVTLSCPVVAQDRDWYCPSSPALPDGSPTWEKWFVGSIGSIETRMHLIGAGNIAKGEFYSLGDWTPVMVGGRLDADGMLLLHDERESNCGTREECDGPGLLQASLTAAGLNGTWRASPGDQPSAMRMKIEPAPKCGVEGPKRVFREIGWPMTFEYPAAWGVNTTKNTVSLLCPNPDWMAYQGVNLTLTKGILAPGGDLPNEAILSEFTKDSNGKWQYESSLGGGPSAAIVDQHDGMTIIRSKDASRRGYCLVGGYSRLTDEELVLILMNSHWILVDGGPQTTAVVNLMLRSAAARK